MKVSDPPARRPPPSPPSVGSATPSSPASVSSRLMSLPGLGQVFQAVVGADSDQGGRILLDFGGGRLEVVARDPLVPGSTVMLEVVEEGRRPVVRLAQSQASPGTPPARQPATAAESRPPDLPVAGQVFRAAVAGVGEGGRFALDWSGGRLEVVSRDPLPAGASVLVEMVEAGQVPRVRLASPGTAPAELIRLLASSGGFDGLPETASRLAPFLPAERAPALADLFKMLAGAAVRDRPQPKELADLVLRLLPAFSARRPVSFLQEWNAVASEVLAALQGQGKGQATGVPDGLDPGQLSRVFRALDLVVGMNATSADASAPLFFIPCLFADRAGAGEWLFRAGGREGGGTTGVAALAWSFFCP